MARIILFFVVFLSGGNAFAFTEIELCARKADRLIKNDKYPRIFERQEFTNTTPGSYNQQYMGVYMIDGRKVTAVFSSPFICDELRLESVSR